MACCGKFFETERQFFEPFANDMVDISFVRAVGRHAGQDRQSLIDSSHGVNVNLRHHGLRRQAA